MALFIRFSVLNFRVLILDIMKRYQIYKFSMENNCSISLNSKITGSLSNLKVGKGTVINGNANFRFKSGEITIGENCLIASNLSIVCNTYKIQGRNPISPSEMYSKNVSVGNNVWIGGNVIILPGVVIGDNSIIGAASLVTKEVPSNEVWGGVPAKLLYKR